MNSQAQKDIKSQYSITMGFRENLKDELSYQDITVKELALRTGISKHTIDHYLTKNGSQPQAELAVKIAQALNVSVESLVLGNEQNFDKKPRNVQELTEKISGLSDKDYDFVRRLVNLLG